MSRRLLLILVLGVFLVSAVFGAKYTLRFGHVLAPGEPYHEAFLKWAKAVEERTNGEVKIEVYPSSQLGVKEKGGEAVFIHGDVARDAEQIVKKTVEAFGRLDILVNNAGIVPYGNVEETTEEDFDRTIAVNVKGPFFLSKYAVEQMKKQGGGVIVNVSSEAGLIGIPRRCVYSVSKAALLGLTRSLAVDYVDYGIRVNAVCPGTTQSEGLMARVKASPNPEELLKKMTSRIPMKRLGKEEEIAFAILFAACDEAGFMTGSIINIDGGSTAV